MMYDFSLAAYLIMAAVIIICLIFLLYFNRTIEKHFHAEKRQDYRKYGLRLLISGIVLSLLSLCFHIYFQIDRENTPRFIRILSDATAEPALVLTILFFILGLTIIVSGFYTLQLSKKLDD